MTQLYQRNPARHGLLARQGGNALGNGPGNHSGSTPAVVPTTSQVTGMYTAQLLLS